MPAKLQTVVAVQPIYEMNEENMDQCKLLAFKFE